MRFSMPNFLFKTELMEAYQAIQHEGGYANNHPIIIPMNRFFQPFQQKQDLIQHALTIVGSVRLALIIPLPSIFMAISDIFQCLGAIFHLNMLQTINHLKDSLTTLTFGCVVTAILLLNAFTHTLSILTRGLSTGSEFLYGKIAPKPIQAL
jgi:hypothetical protein